MAHSEVRSLALVGSELLRRLVDLRFDFTAAPPGLEQVLTALDWSQDSSTVDIL